MVLSLSAQHAINNVFLGEVSVVVYYFSKTGKPTRKKKVLSEAIFFYYLYKIVGSIRKTNPRYPQDYDSDLSLYIIANTSHNNIKYIIY